MKGQLRFGSTKRLKVGQVYRSTNGKWIRIMAVTEKQFTFLILMCNTKKGRPKSHRPGAEITVKRSCISNYIGPMELHVDLWAADEWGRQM